VIETWHPFAALDRYFDALARNNGRLDAAGRDALVEALRERGIVSEFCG